MADTPIYGLGICAGALGLELGLEIAIPGYRTVCMVEREIAVCGRVAARLAEGSIAPLACWDDVTTFDGKPWRGIVSIISAGFPCQPFSVAGKRGGTSDERWIWPDIARVIGEIEPEIVFLENVPGLLLDPDSDTDRWQMEVEPDDALGGMGTVLRDLAELGFNAEWLCLRASDVGASHGRKRVFILAYNNDPRRARALRETLARWNAIDRSCESMENAGYAGIGRATEQAGIDRQGPSGDDRRASGTLEYTECPERREGAIGSGCSGAGIDREGEAASRSGNGVDLLGQSASTRHQERGDSLGVREQPAAERTGSELGYSESGRLGIGGEPSGSVGLPDGTDATLAHTARHGESGPDGESGGIGRRGIRKAGERMEDADSGYPQLNAGIGRSGPGEEIGTGSHDGTGGSSHDLGIFAPGHSDPIWEDVLLRRPWLRPSWSQAEAQSHFRNLVDGLAPLLATERTTALRALGNGVVPLQAAAAFRILARRVMNHISHSGKMVDR